MRVVITDPEAFHNWVTSEEPYNSSQDYTRRGIVIVYPEGLSAQFAYQYQKGVRDGAIEPHVDDDELYDMKDELGPQILEILRQAYDSGKVPDLDKALSAQRRKLIKD